MVGIEDILLSLHCNVNEKKDLYFWDLEQKEWLDKQVKENLWLHFMACEPTLWPMGFYDKAGASLFSLDSTCHKEFK